MLNPYRPQPLAGVVFSEASVEAGRSVRHHWGRDNRWETIPDSVLWLPAGLRPRKQGVNWMRGMSVAAAALMLLWAASMTVSFIANRHLVAIAQEQVRLASAEKQPLAVRLHALSALQKTLSQLEYRSQHGAPWYARGGLSQNDDLLAALFPRYGEMAQPLLRDAAAEHLQRQLNAFVQLPPDSPLREKMTKTAYGQLKRYLMLTRPEKMDAKWFATTLMQDWPQRSGVADAIWQGSGPSLLAFYAASLASHPQWRLPVDDGLVSQVRTQLIRQMGQRNSESTLYQKMLAQVANQYADMRLADMTADTDASRLFSTDEVVPGMFTRQAWEQAVQPAIEKVVAERRDEMDWVLSDTKQTAAQSTSPETLRARLAERYFADFSGAWLDFLNSLRWQRAATLSDAIDQLTLMADVRQSPLVALMNTLSVQGRTSAGDRMLAMEEAIAQLENALGIAKSLASAAESAQALPSDTGNQQTLNDALKELAQPGIVLNAPQGVSISSPQAVRLSSGSACVGIVSQQNTDISALKRFTVAAGEAVSLLARKAGMKLFAAKGKIEIQAQDDALEATAKKDITVTSVEGRVEITAAEELVVNCAGAYIRLSGGNIELGCPGNILLKSANVQKMGKADFRVPPLELPEGFEERFTVKDQKTGDIVPFARYRITTEKGQVFEGRADADGKTASVYTALPESIKIELL